jgi:hypothetical protein
MKEHKYYSTERFWQNSEYEVLENQPNCCEVRKADNNNNNNNKSNTTNTNLLPLYEQ